MKAMDHILFNMVALPVLIGKAALWGLFGWAFVLTRLTRSMLTGRFGKWPVPGRTKQAALVLLLMTATGIGLWSQDRTERRTVHRDYPANRQTTLEVQNKYGKIQVVTWEKDSVAIDADVFMTESSASRLRKLKEDININISFTNNYIFARTAIESERGRIARELKSVAAALTGENKKVEINYMVHAPAYVDVVLLNKFGDIYMDDMESQVEIDLSNGALKANNLTGISSINLSFANGMIGSLGSATMKLAYSDLVVGDVDQLDLNSKSSKLNADRVDVLKINSRRDKLYFKNVEYFYGNGNFSRVWVYDFLRESDVYMKYGQLTIEHVLPEFSKIFVESEYTDVTLYFHPESRFGFDILYHEKATLRLPDERTEAEETFEGSSHYRVRGNAGDGEGAGSVQIDALQKCFINLSYK